MVNEKQLYIFPFSAKSKEALKNTSERVVKFLKEQKQINLADASWTLQIGRRLLEFKKIVIASRADIECNTFHVCNQVNGVVEKKKNLVLMLPEIQDSGNELWKEWDEDIINYPIVDIYHRAATEILQLLPDSIVNEIRTGTNVSQEIQCYRALVRGYSSVKMLSEIGISPTALSGEGIAELTAMVCSRSISISNAIDIIQKYGACKTYVDVYPIYLEKRQIPIIKKPGKKAKAHIDEATTLKLSNCSLENSITKLCMDEVNLKNCICLISNNHNSFIKNIYIALSSLWCAGININWNRLNNNLLLKRVPLPSYVFDKKKYDSDILINGKTLQKKTEKKEKTTENNREKTDLDAVLKKLWYQILGTTTVNKNDDFFANGGSSLDAIMLSAKVKEELKVEFPISDIFRSSTFGKMLKFITEHINYQSEDKIKKLKPQDYFETSSAQKRMFVLNEIINDAVPYNLATVYQIKGKIEKEKIQNCFFNIVKRHEAFRTSFDMINGKVVQIIKDYIDFKVDFFVGVKEHMKQEIRAQIKPFNLKQAPLLRVAVISYSEWEHILVLDMHHIISDQSSLAILLKEIRIIYEGGELPELEIQYKDFAKWQNDFFNSAEASEQLEYWKKELAGDIPVLELYTDYDRLEIMNYAGGRVHFSFEEELCKQIRAFTKENNITPYMFIMAAISILLWRYTNQNECIIGTPVAGRKHEKLKSIIGMFVNTLAIKSNIDENISVREYLQYMKQKLIKAYDYQDCQFDVLVEALNIPKNNSRNPLFDVLFNYINIETDNLEIEGLDMMPYDDGILDVKFDLTFTMEEKAGKFELDIDYMKSLFKSETINLMGERLLHIILEMVEGGEQLLKEIHIMTVQEQKWLLETVNKTTTDYPANKTVLCLFEQMVKKYPDKIAIEWMEEKITYLQLNSMANQMADKLNRYGIGYQDLVTILLERGYMQIVSMLGIMKLGAVYIPIDIQFPQERINYILEDSKSKAVITTLKLTEKIERAVQKVLIDAEENKMDRYIETEIENEYTPDEFHSEDSIYVLYTSGSTGVPKGTFIMHKNIVRVVKNTNYIEICECDRVIQLSNYVFDLSVFDIYSALLNGATLVIIPREKVIDISALTDFLQKEEISIACISTALFHLIVDWKVEALKTIRKIIVAGEQISLRHSQKAVKAVGAQRIINGYGPTETGIFATYYPVNDVENASIVPIGYPLSNTTVFVVDEQKKLVPLNVAGELYIGGDAVGKGYLNKPEVTYEKYINLEAAGGQRVYCTGDRVVWNSNRELVFLGRKDFQVKIRSHRIELGEVERYIENVDGIKKAIVITEKDAFDTLCMIAYYTLMDNSKEIQEINLQDILRSRLPEYMLPSKFIRLNEFPLNQNGKIDKKALPKIVVNESPEPAKEEPRTELERLLLKIMKNILNVSAMGIKDDFFRYGGQSIKAIAFVKELSNHDISIKVNDIFQYRTVEKIAQMIEADVNKDFAVPAQILAENVTLNELQINILIKQICTGSNELNEIITSLAIKEQFPMSAIQRGHMMSGSDYSGFVSRLEGVYLEQNIKMVLANIICSNQLLHCSLVNIEDDQNWSEYETSQISSILSESVAYKDISMYTQPNKEVIIRKLCDQLLVRSYSGNELLWRMCVLKLRKDEHLIIWGVDHLIFDGMSAQVIKSQLDQKMNMQGSYNNRLVTSYKEYVELLEQGPSNITQEEIINQFELIKWSEENYKVMKKLQELNQQKKRNIEVVIPLSEVSQTDIWWYAFDFTARIVGDYIGKETIPFAMVNYGRSYQEFDFYNTVGEFLDIIPIVYEKEQNNVVEDVTWLCKHYSVNFVTLLGNTSLKQKYPIVHKLLGEYYYNNLGTLNFILYNFQGFVEREEKDAFINNIKENELAMASVTVSYDAKNLYIELVNLTGMKEEEVKTLVKLNKEWKRNEN